MTKLRKEGPPTGPSPLDPDLTEFSSHGPTPCADPSFREELRAALWQLWRNLVAPFRR